jgi:hypothetical protein
MDLDIVTVLPDGQPKLVDGYPFTLSDVPPGVDTTWQYGYCTAVKTRAGRQFFHADMFPLWNAGVGVEYAGACLGAGGTIQATVQGWRSGVAAEYAATC